MGVISDVCRYLLSGFFPLLKTFYLLAPFAVVAVSGDLMPAIQFCMQYPEVITQIALFSICSAMGQNFVSTNLIVLLYTVLFWQTKIYYTINQFGSLTCTTVTTTRKFFTILASVIWFGHDVTPLQWFAVALVFIGLGVDIVYSYQTRKDKNKQP